MNDTIYMYRYFNNVLNIVNITFLSVIREI